MQRVQLEENEEITRKEYMRRKKLEKKKITRRSKITYIMISLIVLLISYIVWQIVLYNTNNNYSYLADENVIDQSVYNVYYITEGYTYDPQYSLSSIYSNGFNDTVLLSNIGFTNIKINSNYVLGIKGEKLFAYDKKSMEMIEIVSDKVVDYTVYNDEAYLIVGDNKKLYSYNIESKELKDLGIEQVNEILVDDSNLYIAKNEKIKKQLYKLQKNGSECTKIASDANVSYIIQDESKLYFVNKSDDNKIYQITKDGSEYKKVGEITSVTDNGVLKNIDGSKYMYIYNKNLYYINSSDNDSLWKYNLENGENSKEIYMQVEILQNVEGTVFYKIKNGIGVYLYNSDTKFMSEITKRKVKEFAIDTYQKVFIDETKVNELNKKLKKFGGLKSTNDKK